MREMEELFAALGQSSFRRKFRLDRRDAEYLSRCGLKKILDHGRELIAARLAAARPERDGRQTPMRGHPVFVAQHATGTCCRKCLQRWHGLEVGRPLTESEIDYVLAVLGHWLERHGEPCSTMAVDKQQRLFPADS